MTTTRCPENPIIKLSDVKPYLLNHEIIGVFNAAVAYFNGQVILLLRVAEKPIVESNDYVCASILNSETQQVQQHRFSKSDPANDFSDPRVIKRTDGERVTSISHLRLARSEDGVHFHIDEKPFLFPTTPNEVYGIEDPHISLIGDIYYISYVAVSDRGVSTALACTQDFKKVERLGIIFAPDNKDVVILPERIRGRYYALHRPTSEFAKRQHIWIAESGDLRKWGNHRYLLGTRINSWEENKIGASCVPFKTDRGWVEIYHGVDKNNRYCLGGLLLNLHEPWKIHARSKRPILEPEADFECQGFFGDTVFSCGCLFENNIIKIYYGASDTVMAFAEISIEDVWASFD